MRMPRVWFTVRGVMVVVAVAALVMGGAVDVHRRRANYQRRAAYHLQAESLLIDRAGGPLGCSTGLSDEDIDQIFCGRGPEECRAYKAAMYHYAMYEKYQQASERPWLLAAADPPPPLAANPKFEPEPLYLDMVKGDDTTTGFH